VQLVKKFLKKLAARELSVERLTLSFCLGVLIALSPFWGLHMVLAFGLSWLVGLNVAVVFTTMCAINNPLTMCAIVASQYVVGQRVLVDLMHINVALYNPVWLNNFNTWISTTWVVSCVGTHFSIWHFLVGSLLTSVVCSVALYPVMRLVFAVIVRSIKQTAKRKAL
jgi:uncharacterized protein (DUF2062 family)